MRIPIESVLSALKLGASTARSVEETVRVSIYVDASAAPDIVQAVREAFVPQTTAGIVRVHRLEGPEPVTKPETDLALVISSGSPYLQQALQHIVVAGAPTAVLASSSTEVPFIERDTPLLGLVCATDRAHLLSRLAHWILDRTEKRTAFAAAFPFMRLVACRQTIASCAAANLITGALEFVPGADFPVMALSELGMMMELATVFGKPVAPERGYEVAAVLAGGLALRAGTRQLVKRIPYGGFAVKAVVGAAGAYAMGSALCALYRRDVDYSGLNAALARIGAAARTVADGIGARREADTL